MGDERRQRVRPGADLGDDGSGGRRSDEDGRRVDGAVRGSRPAGPDGDLRRPRLLLPLRRLEGERDVFSLAGCYSASGHLALHASFCCRRHHREPCPVPDVHGAVVCLRVRVAGGRHRCVASGEGGGSSPAGRRRCAGRRADADGAGEALPAVHAWSGGDDAPPPAAGGRLRQRRRLRHARCAPLRGRPPPGDVGRAAAPRRLHPGPGGRRPLHADGLRHARRGRAARLPLRAWIDFSGVVPPPPEPLRSR